MRAIRFLQGALVGLAVALLLPSAAGADELKQLYAQILRNPTNSELNFRYAELAEQRGELRKALAAYERVLLNDPNHPQVMRALQRVRRKLQPNTTQFVAELGASWETNPRRLSTGANDDGVAHARITMRDERGFGDASRWRTIGQLLGDIYFDNSDLTYGYAGAYTGPVIDILPGIAVHAALGGGASYLDHRLFYSEATANLTFESYLEGAFHAVRFRGGYRQYDDFFPSNNGFYADVIGKFSFPNVLAPNDVFVVSPWFRWSDMSGTGFSLITPTEQVQPGRYVEYGGRLEYYRRIVEWLTVGANISVTQRDYATSTNLLPPPPTMKRRDLTVVPGATLIFHHVGGYQNDLRLDYRYEHNDSNAVLRDYVNHLTTLMLISRF